MLLWNLNLDGGDDDGCDHALITDEWVTNAWVTNNWTTNGWRTCVP